MRTKKRELLRNELYHRVGELLAQLGRYDMYALSLARQIGAYVRRPAFSEVGISISNRGIGIRRRMVEMNIESAIQVEFASIDTSMRTIVDRLVIAAHSGATLAFRFEEECETNDLNRDWFNPYDLSEIELSNYINTFERESLKVVALYIRLSACSARISQSVN